MCMIQPAPSYHHWLTPDEFNAQFGPTEEDYQKVLAFAQTNGLTVTSKDARRRLLNVTAPVATVENAFHVTLRTYQHPTEARQFYAPDTEPTVDASVPILSVDKPEQLYHTHAALKICSPGQFRIIATATGERLRAERSLHGQRFRGCLSAHSLLQRGRPICGTAGVRPEF